MQFALVRLALHARKVNFLLFTERLRAPVAPQVNTPLTLELLHAQRYRVHPWAILALAGIVHVHLDIEAALYTYQECQSAVPRAIIMSGLMVVMAFRALSYRVLVMVIRVIQAAVNVLQGLQVELFIRREW